MDDASESVRVAISDPSIIRALGHPARLAIIEHLKSSGSSATATELAHLVEMTPSATSYHLRAMWRAGLIEEVEGPDGRERRWKSLGRGWAIVAEDGKDSAKDWVAAERVLISALLVRADDRISEWFSRTNGEAAEWVDAMAVFDSTLLVTAEELEHLNAAYQELISHYLQSSRRVIPEGARLVNAHYRAVPSVSAIRDVE